MNALLVLDYYVWKFFVVRTRPAWFKSKLVSLVALLYVALFPLPRKFLLHYFNGQGRSLRVDTRELILHNQRVLDCLRDYGQNMGVGEGGGHGHGAARRRIPIGQHLVSNPDHRYSIGSFNLICESDGDLLHVTMTSQYHFSGDHDRITRYLHHWMDKIRENGNAARFSIEGNTWTISRREMMSLNAHPRKRKYIDYNVLYI